MKIYIFPEKHVVCLESLAIWIHMDTWMVEGHGESSHPNVFFPGGDWSWVRKLKPKNLRIFANSARSHVTNEHEKPKVYQHLLESFQGMSSRNWVSKWCLCFPAQRPTAASPTLPGKVDILFNGLTRSCGNRATKTLQGNKNQKIQSKANLIFW